MAVSPGLAWSLANGISQAQYDQNLLEGIKQGEAQGLSDAQFESLMNQYGISAADVARVTQATPEAITARMEAATPTTAAEIAFNRTAMDELAGREAQWAEQQRQNEINWAAQQRQNVTLNNQNIAKNQTDWAAQQRQNELQWAAQQRLNAENWAKQQAKNEADWAAQQAARAQVNPFMTATQGFEQNFQNYQSIPIGAQYNPGVTAGGASPYNQIMSQMRPVGNPYATVQGGQAMGGYDPGLYERQRVANIALRDAGLSPYGGVLDISGGDGPSGGGDSTGNAAASAAASGSSAGASGGPGGTGIGEGGGTGMGGWYKGGLIDRVGGPNPKGPDDGAGYLQLGEYVIKKSSVDKYGKGLLDMINDGKIPAKKMKSLLG